MESAPSDRPGLLRLADITPSGDLVRPDYERSPWTYWKQLYQRGGPSEIGSYGVWSWTGTPNPKNPERWYVNTHYDPAARATFVSNAFMGQSAADIAKQLREGFQEFPTGTDVIFLTEQYGTHYKGIFVAENQVEKGPDGFKVKDGLSALPVFAFSDLDLYFADRDAFWGATGKPNIKPESFMLLVSPAEAVRDQLLASLSWKNYQAKAPSGTHKDHDEIKALIRSCAEEANFVPALARKLGVPEDEGRKYVDDFVAGIDRTLDGNTLTDEVILAALEKHPEVAEREKQLITDGLAGELKEANEMRETLSKAYDEMRETFSKADAEVNEEYLSLTAKRAEILTRIKPQIRFFSDMNGALEKRLKNSSAELANIAAELPFLKLIATEAAKSLAEMRPKEPPRHAWRFSFQEAPTGPLKRITARQELVELLEENLKGIGTAPERATTLAAFLYACFRHNQPLLLAGPGGKALAEAASVSITGKHAALLDCSGPYAPDAFDEVDASEAEVITVSNPLRPEWTEPLMRLCEETSKLLFLVQPFKEDLKIEPSGLCGYALPLLTEAFMESRKKKTPTRPTFAKAFRHSDVYTGPLQRKDAFDAMGLNTVSETSLGGTLGTAKQLAEGDDLDEELEFLCGLLPVAYMTGRTDILAAELDRASLDDSLAKLIKRLGGIPS